MIATSEKFVVKDVKNKIPEKFLSGLRDNNQLKDCCRIVESHTVQIFKSSENLPVPDMTIIECEKCGAKHRRMSAFPMGA